MKFEYGVLMIGIGNHICTTSTKNIINENATQLSITSIDIQNRQPKNAFFFREKKPTEQYRRYRILYKTDIMQKNNFFSERKISNAMNDTTKRDNFERECRQLSNAFFCVFFFLEWLNKYGQ